MERSDHALAQTLQNHPRKERNSPGAIMSWKEQGKVQWVADTRSAAESGFTSRSNVETAKRSRFVATDLAGEAPDEHRKFSARARKTAPEAGRAPRSGARLYKPQQCARAKAPAFCSCNPAKGSCCRVQKVFREGAKNCARGGTRSPKRSAALQAAAMSLRPGRASIGLGPELIQAHDAGQFVNASFCATMRRCHSATTQIELRLDGSASA
jgi:hypothetical protein